MTRLEGKTAIITGAARGQGRAHAATLAGHGADIVAVDTTGSRDSMNYDLATSEDLEGTVKEVESTGRRPPPAVLSRTVRSPADGSHPLLSSLCCALRCSAHPFLFFVPTQAGTAERRTARQLGPESSGLCSAMATARQSVLPWWERRWEI